MATRARPWWKDLPGGTASARGRRTALAAFAIVEHEDGALRRILEKPTAEQLAEPDAVVPGLAELPAALAELRGTG